MDSAIGTQIFWMIALGLVIGFLGHYVYGKRGVALMPSILIALAGALVTGISALFFGFNLPLSYSLIGALGFLFVVNVFRQKDRTIFVNTDRSDGDQA